MKVPSSAQPPTSGAGPPRRATAAGAAAAIAAAAIAADALTAGAAADGAAARTRASDPVEHTAVEHSAVVDGPERPLAHRAHPPRSARCADGSRTSSRSPATTRRTKETTMRRPSNRQSLIAAMSLTGALLLTACGGTDAPAADEDSPLTSFYKSISGDLDPEAQQKKFEEQNRKAEELVAACMAEQGFEYTPVDQSAGMVTMDEERDPEEYAAEYGYGMTIVQEPSAEEQAEMESYVDPNQAYTESMSETELNAYYAALHGDMAAAEPDENGEIPPMETAEMGCWGAAQNEASGGEQELWESEDMIAFSDASSKLYEDIAKSPKMDEVTAKWSDCMADAGFDHATPQEAMDSFMEASNSLYENQSPEGPSEAEQAEIDEKLSTLQEEEKDTAVADQACQEKVGYQDVYRTVTFELEQAFVDENKDLLDRVTAAYAEFEK